MNRSNEADLPPLNPQAVAMVDSLRIGDRESFMKFVAEDPKLLNARGPEGSTPFMYAVLYAGAVALEELLKKGADPSARNDANATALMYAATSDLLPLDVVKLLIERGADVNARSQHAQSGDTGLTALDLAKMRGETPIVALLIKSGATGAGRPTPALKPQRGNTIPNAIQHSLPCVNGQQRICDGKAFGRLADRRATKCALLVKEDRLGLLGNPA